MRRALSERHLRRSVHFRLASSPIFERADTCALPDDLAQAMVADVRHGVNLDEETAGDVAL